MIEKVVHQDSTLRPTGITLALDVAYELPAPKAYRRAPEPASPAPQLMGLRRYDARPHRRKVPLTRLTTLTRLTALGV
ncbi:hypothetical protein ABZ865_40750 [Streptomyces sp. NPDC047085]|uniref:hypothetical protein n=1 Tax=Streptomyces sp. NPDC047085 TaxID=3155140 RepID=UPI0034082724